jgi:hypothetical protein
MRHALGLDLPTFAAALALLDVLGKEAEPVVDTADPVHERNSRQRFLLAYAKAHALDTSVDGVTTPLVGTDQSAVSLPHRRADWTLADSIAP